MARIRSIKPAFWSSLTISSLPIDARLTFIGIWNYADDYGRAPDDARLVKAAVWPLDDRMTATKVERHLGLLTAKGLLTRYDVGGKHYFQVTSWKSHQRVDKPQPSAIPPDPGQEDSANVPGTTQERSTREVEVDRKGSGNGEEVDIAPRKRDALFEVVAEVCGIDWHELTDSARGPLNKSVAQIRAQTHDPDEVRRRADNWQYDVPLTPPGLAKHWPALGVSKPRTSSQTTRLLALADSMEAQR